MNAQMISEVRYAVRDAVRYWPNAHLGDLSEAEDRRSAFRFIRNRLRAGWHIQAAVGDLEMDALRHRNM